MSKLHLSKPPEEKEADQKKIDEAHQADKK